MNVSIIGSGNVGSAFGEALTLKGHDVLFYDIVPKKLSVGQFTLSFEDAFQFGEALVICVPTELTSENYIDLSIYKHVCRQFGQCLLSTSDDKHLKKMLIQKSTCTPGTARAIIAMFKKEFGLVNGEDFEYIVFPSFTNMGQALQDELRQRKCLIGLPKDTSESELIDKMKKFLYWADPQFNSCEAVELTKFASNIFHASIISIWNEIFLLGQELNVDTDWIARKTVEVAGLESVYRVHGKAWGGRCLPKDTRAILEFSRDLGVPMPVLEAVIAINDLMAKKHGVQTKHWSDLHKEWPFDNLNS